MCRIPFLTTRRRSRRRVCLSFFLSFRETTIFCFIKREMMRKKRSSKSLKIFLFVASSMNREEHYLSHESTLAH